MSGFNGAAARRGAIAALVLCAAAAFAAPAKDAHAQGALECRVLYAPGHFGNSYEVLGEREMADCLGEAKAWGFNVYADWFDTVDCSDPFAGASCDMGRALWERKKVNYRSAQRLGLPCWMVITPNHVYRDQCLPERAAKTTDRIFGQLVCPSVPEARETILKNYENLFADLANAGVKLSGLASAPYDYGGCACERCAPWILTFAQLSRDIHAIAAKHHPGIEMHFIGWWWEPQEHEQFARWADEHAPGWAKSMFLHMPYGKVEVADVPLPRGCERRAFVHIGYAEEASPRDTYGHLGPVIAADRIERSVAALSAQGCTGVMAYSEGVYDDVNKALLAGLASRQHEDAERTLQAYARRYFAAGDDRAPAWASWLRAWGKPYGVGPVAASEALSALLRDAPSDAGWRRAQWEAKTRLMLRYAEVAEGADWRSERLAAADAFWAEQERMQREVYGLGLLRHVLHRRYSPFPWYAGWSKAVGSARASASGEE